MLDISPYILPINKESVPDIASATALARQAQQAGVHTIIAAPRYIPGKFENNKDSIINLVKKLNDTLQKEKIKISILPSQTIRIDGKMIEQLTQSKLIGYGTDPTYIFIEIMYDHIPQYTQQLCYDLQLIGFKPVLVHPEKNNVIQEEPNTLYSLVKNGALVQISAKSICGKKGRKIQKCAQQLLKHNLVHFVGSDTAETKRYFLQPAWKILKRNLPIEQFYLLQENMNLLEEAKTVQGEEPQRIKKKKILGII